MELRSLLGRATLASMVAFGACASPDGTGPSDADYVSGLATLAQVAGLPQTADQAAFIAGVGPVADHVSNKESSKLSAPNTEVNVYDTNGNSNSSEKVHPLDKPYDWDHILLDNRVLSKDYRNGKVVFALNGRWLAEWTPTGYSPQQRQITECDLYIADSNGTNIHRINRTPFVNELAPRWISDHEIEYEAVHVGKQIGSYFGCDMAPLKNEDIIFSRLCKTDDLLVSMDKVLPPVKKRIDVSNILSNFN